MMKIFQKNSKFSKFSKTFLFAVLAVAIILSVCLVYKGIQRYESLRDLNEDSASLSASIESEQSQISEYNDVTNKKSDAYKNYVESSAREEGYGQADEYEYINGNLGN